LARTTGNTGQMINWSWGHHFGLKFNIIQILCNLNVRKTNIGHSRAKLRFEWLEEGWIPDVVEFAGHRFSSACHNLACLLVTKFLD
jgi:hypothetical protein